MSLFKAPFTPALNKLGEAKLTFIGLEVKTGKTKAEGRDYQINNLKFEMMGKVRGTSTFVNITSGTTFDIESNFCKALTNMGLNPQILLGIYSEIFEDVETIEDENGFEVEDCSEDDDGFAVEDARDFDFSEIEEFCILNCQKVFTGKVFLNDKKYWEINAETIKPLTKPKTEKENKGSKKTSKKSKKTTEQDTETDTEVIDIDTEVTDIE